MDKHEPLGEVLGWLLGAEGRAGRADLEVPVVCDGRRAYGIVDPRRFLAGGLTRQSAVEKVTLPVQVLSAADPELGIEETFARTQALYLPLVDGNGRPTGVVFADDYVAQALGRGPTAAEATRRVPILTSEDSVERALHAFQEAPVDALPFVSQSGVSLLPRRALVHYVANAADGYGSMPRGGEREPVRDDPIEHLTVRPMATLAPGDGYAQVRTALEHGPALVVQGGRPLGIVTGTSVLAALHPERPKATRRGGPVIRYS